MVMIYMEVYSPIYILIKITYYINRLDYISSRKINIIVNL